MTELFPEHLETDRLRLERVEPGSVDALDHYEAFADDPDPETVYEYVPVDEPDTPADSKAFVATAGRSAAEADAVTYLIRPRSGEPGAGEIAGSTILYVDWETRLAQPAILLRKPFWGRGYSGERAGALLELAFERLDLECVAVGCAAGNERSKRAIENYVDAYGGAYEGRFRDMTVVDGEPFDLHRYSITRAAYRSATDERSGTNERETDALAGTNERETDERA
ncbi:GNAT family N-acetyltransferase [Halovivax limisalsi]|uniref:GNAT family N-acetyltransferase n=1 Tax=Halovivax limisalsi TaxID=1453760 RepID=UPI001FFDE179|nr:GNAT family protein [Halovivax limisalsi]